MSVTGNPLASKTYIVGANAFYDKDLIDQWKLNTDLSAFTTSRIWLFYRSNWRILHIDGFEPGYGNHKISFKFDVGTSAGKVDLSRFSDKKLDIV
jgi:hypothetical protein